MKIYCLIHIVPDINTTNNLIELITFINKDSHPTTHINGIQSLAEHNIPNINSIENVLGKFIVSGKRKEKEFLYEKKIKSQRRGRGRRSSSNRRGRNFTP